MGSLRHEDDGEVISTVTYIFPETPYAPRFASVGQAHMGAAQAPGVALVQGPGGPQQL